ncbi:MAG: hypothetical protein R2863_03040 [Candidatus Kapaibacterium sp.]
MKKIILLIAIMAFVGCKEETPTETKITIKKEYTLEELENDTNWVEVTDIDTIKQPCIWGKAIEHGKLIKNMNELRSVYKKSDSISTNYSEFCFDADSLGINFNNRSLILYWIDRHPAEIERKIFRNDKLKQYIYVAGFTGLFDGFDNSTFGDKITVSKVEENYSFRFDTLKVKE